MRAGCLGQLPSGRGAESGNQSLYLHGASGVVNRSAVLIVHGLMPALKDRGFIRAAYAHKQFRDNLLQF
jgi:hypothetical protein